MLPSPHRRPARRVRTRLWQFAAVLLLGVAAYVVVGRQVMQLAPYWHQALETRLARQLGTPLEIGSLAGRMDGLSPVVELNQVRLPAPEGAPLVLDQVVLTVDLLSSLVERELRLRRLLIRGAELELARTPDGLALKGLETRRDPPSLRRILAWTYRQNRVVLDEVRLGLHWPDMPTLRTRDLELALVNAGHRHRVSLRAPSLDGQRRLDLRLALDRDVFRWSAFDGDLFVELSGSGWQHWVTPAWPWPVTPERIEGQVSIWAELTGGKPRTATARVNLDRLDLHDRRNDSRWSLTRAASLARLDRLEQGYRLSLQRMELDTAHGDWRVRELGLRWNGRQKAALGWRVLARGLDLADTRKQLLGLPFATGPRLDAWRERLRQLRPSGRVEHLRLAGDASGVNAFGGEVRGLGTQARQGWPGVQGLSGWFAGSPDQGVARVDSEAMRMQLPGFYDHPIEARVNGSLRWDRDGGRFSVRSGLLEVRNEHARAAALLGVQVEPNQPAELRLLGELREGDAAAAAHYVPGRQVPRGLGQWLRKAIGAGRVTRGRFLYQGPLRIDPARQQDRTFQMGFRVADLRLHYLDGWPELRELSGHVRIDGRRVEGRGLSGRMLGTELSGLSFDVPAVAPGQTPELIVSGRLRGPAGDLDRIADQTPLRETLPPALHDWELEGGSLNARLVLGWPLGEDGREPRLMAQGRLEDAVLKSGALPLQGTGLTGDFAYDLRRGLVMERLTGQLLGEPVTGSVTAVGGQTRVQVQGRAPVSQLRDLTGGRLLREASGHLDYSARVDIPRSGGRVRMALSSPLTGLALDMPAPLGKDSGARVPLALDWRRQRAADQLSIRYGQRLAARLYVGAGRVQRGHVVLGGGSPRARTQAGVRVSGSLRQLAVDPWVQWWRDRASKVDVALPLEQLALEVGQLKLSGLRLSAVRLTATASKPGGWQLGLDSEQLAGSARLPPGYSPEGETPLELHVRRAELRLDEQGGGVPGWRPKAVPIANVRLEDIRVNGTDYGRWRFAARPVDSGVMFREIRGWWRNTGFNGRLRWTPTKDGGTRSHFVGRLTADRLEASLKAFGLGPLIESQQARSVVDLSWPGSPLAFDYRQVSGHASVNIGPCRIPDTSRGASALRVLGILNISSLSRRLRLDFSDLYKKGLSCDSISGDFRLRASRITTDNLLIDSPSAEFRISGTMNLAEQTLDHRIEVTLPLSSNLYAGCLAGPAACAGIFVFDRLWGNKLEKLTTLSYRVTGTWNDPKVRELGEDAGSRSPEGG